MGREWKSLGVALAGYYLAKNTERFIPLGADANANEPSPRFPRSPSPPLLSSDPGPISGIVVCGASSSQERWQPVPSARRRLRAVGRGGRFG